MEQWFIQLVTGVYKWLYESIVYGISYDIYECFMFMNSCISQWSGIGLFTSMNGCLHERLS